MRHAPWLLGALGLIAVLFAYWGITTVAGRRMFDEMAGMISMAAGVFGVIGIVSGEVWCLVRLRS